MKKTNTIPYFLSICCILCNPAFHILQVIYGFKYFDNRFPLCANVNAAGLKIRILYVLFAYQGMEFELGSHCT